MPQSRKHWVGDGFNVHPVFNHLAFTEQLSPFLMLDYGAPKNFPPNPNKNHRLGVGQHPHRGFETVTIAFQGEVEHADSTGSRDVIRQNDVQWMTAGRGIIHQEFHSNEYSTRGGMFEMIQLWVNLPAKDKMVPPTYQAIADKTIPKVMFKGIDSQTCSASSEDDGWVRVIAGEFKGTKGPATSYSPIEMYDIELTSANKTLDVPVESTHNVIVFNRGTSKIVVGATNEEDEKNGMKKCKGKVLGPQSVAILERDGGTTVRLSSDASKGQVFLLSGEPLNEPIANQGPFVMNTKEELRQAMIDYQSGDFGQ